MNDEISGITQHFERMSVPDNMKFVLFGLLLFLPIVAQAQTDGYELDAWFWYNHLSTRGNIYTQDYDKESHQAFIQVHFSIADFVYLDSVATSVGFWALPDTIFKKVDTIRVNGELIWRDYSSAPGSQRTAYHFKTPSHDKSVEVLSWQIDSTLRDKLIRMEEAVKTVLESQPNYYTLPRERARY